MNSNKDTLKLRYKDTVFEFMFKDELSADELQFVRDIARMPIIVHPDIYNRIYELLK